jgi:hypothetical protein
VLEISTASKSRLGIPSVKLIANIHGNEAAGREVLLHLIQVLSFSYAFFKNNHKKNVHGGVHVELSKHVIKRQSDTNVY